MGGVRSPLVRAVVVMPTYNEKENVVGILEAIRSAVPAAGILVVDDNSPDGTGALADEAAARLGDVTVLHREGKAGLGAAYRHGFTLALEGGADIVISMDSDFSHDPTVIPAMLSAIEAGADVVIGSRYVQGGGTVDWPLHRQFLSRYGNRYAGWILGMKVHDCTAGFRAYTADALRTIDPWSTTAEGYAFLTEITRRIARRGLRVVETPIIFRDRTKGTSKMSGRIVVESMVLITRLGLGDRRAAWRSRTGRGA